jgi:hypothetical protein
MNDEGCALATTSRNHLTNSRSSLEQIFEWIQRGNDCCGGDMNLASSGDCKHEQQQQPQPQPQAQSQAQYWDAARYYIQVCEGLRPYCTNQDDALHGSIKDQPNNATTTPTSARTEQDKIQALYQSQIDYYYTQTRQCIIRALQQEQEQELQQEQDQTSDSKDTSEKRSKSTTEHQLHFDTLLRFYHYHSPVQYATATATTTTLHDTNHHTQIQKEANDTTTESQLEQRLRQLNASLPRHLKSDDELARDRTQQLQRLGIVVESTHDTAATSNRRRRFNVNHVHDNNSSIRNGTTSGRIYTDPVEEIVAQLTGEVQLEKLQIEEVDDEVETLLRNEECEESNVFDSIQNMNCTELLFDDDCETAELDRFHDKNNNRISQNHTHPDLISTTIAEQLKSVQDSITALQILLKSHPLQQQQSKEVGETEEEQGGDVSSDNRTINGESSASTSAVSVVNTDYRNNNCSNCIHNTNASDTDTNEQQHQQQTTTQVTRQQQTMLIQDIQRTMNHLYQQWQQSKLDTL